MHSPGSVITTVATNVEALLAVRLQHVVKNEAEKANHLPAEITGESPAAKEEDSVPALRT